MAPLTATVKDPDAAYAYFGWWLNKPEGNKMLTCRGLRGWCTKVQRLYRLIEQ